MTRIEWADKSWNPVTGCSPISPGCANCYAQRFFKRLAGRAGYPADNPVRLTFHPDKLRDPYHWKTPRRIFLGSMTDMCHLDIDFRWMDQIMEVILDNPRHTFMTLPPGSTNWTGSLWAGRPGPGRDG